jgi:hypothetical protein
MESTNKPARKKKEKPETLTKYVLKVKSADNDAAIKPPQPVKSAAAKQPVAVIKPPAAIAKPVLMSPVEAAIAKYQAADWTVIKAPKGAINDFMAKRGERFHFVQVVTKETIDDAKFHGEAKNSFVQNAFSNGAIPIFAHVVGKKVTFEDVNSGNRALVTSKKKASVADSASNLK